MVVYINVAGTRMEISSTHPLFCSLLKTRYSQFISADGPASAHIRMSLEDGLDVIEEGPWMEEYRVDVTQKGGKVSVLSYHFRGEFDYHRRTGRLASETGDALGSLDNYLRVVSAGLLCRNEGMLLHAAGLCKGGHGYIFPGPSGAGKSTIASLSGSGRILGDDIIAVREHSDHFTIHSVPMQGEKSFGSGTARLSGIFFPKKDSRNFVERLSCAEAMALLLSGLPFLSEKERTGSDLLARCERLVKVVLVHRLHFTKDTAFWKIISGLELDA